MLQLSFLSLFALTIVSIQFYMDRRKFIKSSCLLCTAGIAGTSVIVESCVKPASPQGPSVNFTIDLTQPGYAALNTSGGSIVSHNVVVVNSGGTYKAVAQACTHQGCAVVYSSGGNDFICNCHGGVYDINGNVTAGPPPAPLKTYSVSKSGNILTVSG